MNANLRIFQVGQLVHRYAVVEPTSHRLLTLAGAKERLDALLQERPGDLIHVVRRVPSSDRVRIFRPDGTRVGRNSEHERLRLKIDRLATACTKAGLVLGVDRWVQVTGDPLTRDP